MTANPKSLRTVSAHSANRRGTEHPLEDHLRETSRMAGGFARAMGPGIGEVIAPAAALAGIGHDIGKASCAWQGYLADSTAGRPTTSPGHSLAGFRAVNEFAACVPGVPFHKALAAGAAILGHHTGLGDWDYYRKELLSSDAATVANVTDAIRWGRLSGIEGDMFALLRSKESLAGIGPFDMAVRNTLSCLVDADWADVHHHHTGHAHMERRADWPAMIDALDTHIAKFGVPSSELNIARRGVLDDCSAAGASIASEPGLYLLSAPTGSGKTVAGLEFALRAAQRLNKRRIVVALPYISIIEQNAATFDNILGDLLPDGVIQHHSGFDFGQNGGRLRTVATGWNAPLVVTTTVQLMETLLSRNPAQLRKLHRLANSVVILDEVQSLPLELLATCKRLMIETSTHYGITWLLCTATQPRLDWFRNGAEIPVVEVAAAPSRAKVFKHRVNYQWRHDPVTPAELATELAALDQVLTIVNTTALAFEVASELAAKTTDGVLHLSTRMCPDHRSSTIAEIRRRLAAGDPCRVVSTQLIEAGVDVDFPVVFRQEAPAESIVQAAGRANREAKRSDSRVVVFSFTEPSFIGREYQYATAVARDHFANDPERDPLCGPGVMRLWGGWWSTWRRTRLG